MTDMEFGFVPSGEGPGFGDVSFSTEPENSSFEVSGDGFGFGAPGDAWFAGSQPEALGFETEAKEKKKKKKKESKKSKEDEGSYGSWLDGEAGKSNGLDPPGDEFAPVSHSARRVSFSEEPPESRTFGNFADKVASATASSPGLSFDEVFEASQPGVDQRGLSEYCSQCGKAFELTDSLYCRHCGHKRRNALQAPRSARSLLGLPGLPGSEVNGANGFGSSNFGERFDEPKPMERRFSFSLSDLPDAQIRISPQSHNGVAAGRENLDLQKWNPLDGIRRHWSPTDVEFQQSVGISAIGALSTNGHPAQILGSLNEAQRAEVRANEMRKKISQLESSLAGHSTAGHVTITAPACHDGLGVILHDLTVTHVTDPLAKQAGWEVGDSILKVNGTTVLHSNQLSMELAKAMSASRAVGRPMIVDVWRHPQHTPPNGNSLLNPSVAPSRSSYVQNLHPAQIQQVQPGNGFSRISPPRATQLPAQPIQPSAAAPLPRPYAPTEPIAVAPVAAAQSQVWTGPKLVSPPPAPQSWAGHIPPEAPPNACIIT